MPICIYPQNCTDFSTNGLGLMTPKSCIAYAEDGHFTELELVQPIADTYRWAQLQKGIIIKAPVPARESPFYEDAAIVSTTRTVTRQIYRVNVRTHLRLRSGPGTNYKILGAYSNGTKVVRLETDGSWYKVSLVKGGKTGWMHSAYLVNTNQTVTESVSQQGVVGAKAIQYIQAEDQPWRIFSVEPDTEKGIVTVKARHVFYDLQNNIIDDDYNPENIAVNQALTSMWNKLMFSPEHELHIAAGLTTEIAGGDYSYKNPVEAMLDTETGMISQAGAQLLLDNWDVWVLPNVIRDSGVTIRRRKNLKGVKATDDDSGVVTRIVPRGKNKDGDPLYITNGTGPKGRGVDSPHLGDYPTPRVRMIDYDVRVAAKGPYDEKTFKTDAQARAKLKELAEADFRDNGLDLPSYGLKVTHVQAQNSAEYEDYAALQTVFLNDTVTIKDELIGLMAKLRVTGFKYNCLTKKYIETILGDVDELTQTVYNYNLPTGGISGTKIAMGTADGSIMRNMTLQYAKISTAAIERLAADAINAVTAYIGELTAQTIETDQLSANMAEVFRLIVNKVTADAISAETIEADTLMASLANMVSVSALYGEFDRTTVQHLVASAMNITQAAVAEHILISNLEVAYAQMVDATIRNLVLRSSEGDYYRLDIDGDGSVTATQVQVTPAEIDAGQTTGGRAILDTDITAANLSTANLLATYALVNKIDAARIDVAELFAQAAFITHLNTADISSNTTVQIVTRVAEEASAAAASAQDDADAAKLLADAMSQQLKLWFTFDSDLGLIVQKMDENGQPVSIWSTVTDEIGYHIRRADLEEYVFSAYRDRVRVQKLEIGDIMIKPSGKGGHVWTRR